MAVSFQNDQQNGRRQSGREMKCYHQGKKFHLKTVVPVAPSSHTVNSSPICWKEFPSSLTHEDSSMTA